MDPSIERVLVPDGVWLVLPARRIPAAIGWIVLAMGAVVTGFMIFWMHGASGGGRSGGPLLFQILTWAFAALGLPGLLIGLGMLVVGIGLLRGVSRCRVGLVGGVLLVREELGRLRWTRRVAVANVRGLLLRRAPPPAIGPVTAATALAVALHIRRAGGTDLSCAFAYPAELVAALADRLGEELRLATGAAPVVAEAGSAQAPPPGNLRVEEADGRLAIELAPRRRQWPLLAFAAIWLAFIGFFTAMAIGLAGGKPASWGLVLFTLPFWAVGIGLVLVFIHNASRRVALLWDGERLTVLDRSPLRRKVRIWERDEVADVVVSERGSGSGSYRAVTVRPCDDRKEEDLATELDREAQEWIAARLRRALGLASV